MKSHNVIFALDIGTTKVCMVAGRKNEYGRVEILGMGIVPSRGVLRGVVSNLEKTAQDIMEAKEMCEKNSGHKARMIHVGIAGRKISSKSTPGLLTRKNHHGEITRDDVNQLLSDMNQLLLPPGDKILHIIPQEYTVDNERGVIDPVGMAGVRLEGDFYIVTAQSNISRNITKCVNKAGMKIEELTLEPIASAAAVLSEEEREAGVVLLDIGGGTADVCIYHNNILRKIAIVPFAGNSITDDIREGCKVMKDDAEALKVSHGRALSSEVAGNKYISIKGLKGREPKEISERSLASIIEARATEIIEFVQKVIENSGYEDKLTAGLVITGGGSSLMNIKELAEYQTGMPTRIGMPVDILAHGYSQEICDPSFSTALGLLIRGISSSEMVEVVEMEETEEANGTITDSSDDEGTKNGFWSQFRDLFGPQDDPDI